MTPTKRLLYNTLSLSVKVYQRLFLDLHVWGRETIPPGPKIYVANHISSTDGLWAIPQTIEPVHVVTGPIYKYKWAARALDYLEQINATPAHRGTVVDDAVRYLKAGESVFVTPEGDLQPTRQLGRFYAGVARMYRRTRAPIIPMALHAPRRAIRRLRFLDMEVEGYVYEGRFVLRGPFCINIGEPFVPELTGEDEEVEVERILRELRDRIRLLVEDICVNKFWR